MRRFVKRASENGIPIAVINAGETRAERNGLSGIVYKSEAQCADLLDRTCKIILGMHSIGNV